MFIKSKKFIPYNKKLKSTARRLRNEMTSAEKKLWYEYLKNHKFSFLRQKPIGNYIIDFYCQELKLAIEVDGETHILISELEHDRQRTDKLNGFGIRVIRFWNDEVLKEFEIVIAKIENEIRQIKK